MNREGFRCDLDLQYAVQHPAMQMAEIVPITMRSIGGYIMLTLTVRSIAWLPLGHLSNLADWLVPTRLFDPHLERQCLS